MTLRIDGLAPRETSIVSGRPKTVRALVSISNRTLRIRATAASGTPDLAVKVQKIISAAAGISAGSNGTARSSSHGSPKPKRVGGSGAAAPPTGTTGAAGTVGTTDTIGSTGSTGSTVSTVSTVSTGSGATPQPTGVAGSWQLAFDDEFNGSSLDTSKWSTSWFGGAPQNNVGTDPANVTVSGGNLILSLSSATDGASVSTNPGGGAGTGFQITYGYVEARIQFAGSGPTISDWPAFWLDGQAWPQNGEADIAEGLGTLTTNYHSPLGPSNSGTIPGAWAGGYHTFGLDREPGTNYIYWDGSLVRSYPTDDGGAPEYIIFNVGYGGGPLVTGPIMKVDYVRAWQH